MRQFTANAVHAFQEALGFLMFVPSRGHAGAGAERDSRTLAFGNKPTAKKLTSKKLTSKKLTTKTI
jgi:hypothetical protein